MRKLLILFIAVLFLTCLVWAAKVAVLSELQRPASITVDGSQVFITEDINVYIYSAKRARDHKNLNVTLIQGLNI